MTIQRITTSGREVVGILRWEYPLHELTELCHEAVVVIPDTVRTPRDTLRSLLSSYNGKIPAELPAGWAWSGRYFPLVSNPSDDEDEDDEWVVMPGHTDGYDNPAAALAVEGAERLGRVGVLENGELSPARFPSLCTVECTGAPFMLGGASGTLYVLPRYPDNRFETVKVPVDILPERACSRCRLPGHNSASCTADRFIDKLGIEIEGRWLDSSWRLDIQAKLSTLNAEAVTDGSIRRRGSLYSREIRTAPGSLTQVTRHLAALYPDETDRSCGMHVHISFMDWSYITQLTTPQFYQYANARWAAWGYRMGLDPQSEFFKRLRGENTYCKRVERHPGTGEDLINMDRYHQWNFSSWHSHKTVECRLLPMFRNAAIGVAAVYELVSLITDWLSGNVETAPNSFALLAASVDMPHWGPSVASVEIELDPDRFEVHHEESLEYAPPPPVSPDHFRLFNVPDNVSSYLRAQGVL